MSNFDFESCLDTWASSVKWKADLTFCFSSSFNIEFEIVTGTTFYILEMGRATLTKGSLHTTSSFLRSFQKS